MSLTDKQFNRSNQIRVTSLRPECLDKLRNPKPNQQNSTHLLAYMSEFMEQKEDKEIQEVDEFCCFDRIKRIIQKKKNSESMGNRMSADDQQNSKITKVLQLQAKMKKMENALQKVAETPTPSKKLTGHRNRRQHDLMGLNKRRLQNFHRKQMICKLKDEAYQKYNQYQKQKVRNDQQVVKDLIGEQIQKKVGKLLEERDIIFNQVSIENKKFQQRLLEKELEIETLKSKVTELNKKIQDLEIYREIVSQSQENKKKQTENQKLAKQFQFTFPNMTVMQVQREIQNLNDKCLNKFYDIECRNWEKWNEEKGQYEKQINKHENTINRLKRKQNQLIDTIKSIKYEHSLATLELDSLIKNKNQLESLQKKILSLYNDWYGSRSESEKALMKNLGYLRQNYEYEEMLDYIVVFRDKLSTNDKVNQYLRKVLRGIQRIRKILFPKQNNNKLDPFDLLDKVQSYIKSKVYEKLYKKGANTKNPHSQKLNEQFLFLQETKENINLKQ